MFKGIVIQKHVISGIDHIDDPAICQFGGDIHVMSVVDCILGTIFYEENAVHGHTSAYGCLGYFNSEPAIQLFG